jgi:hypothetical protein
VPDGARGYRRSGPPSGRTFATTAASPGSRQVMTPLPPLAIRTFTYEHTMLRRPVELKQYTSQDYTQTLDDHLVLASIGTVGDCYDKGLVSHCTSWG